MIETLEPTEIREKTPRETLQAAARYIEEHGWTRYSLHGKDGSACLLGALQIVGPMPIFVDPVYGFLEGQFTRARAWLSEYLYDYQDAQRSWLDRRLGRKVPLDIAHWNDQVAKDQAEVLTVLRAAAAS